MQFACTSWQYLAEFVVELHARPRSPTYNICHMKSRQLRSMHKTQTWSRLFWRRWQSRWDPVPWGLPSNRRRSECNPTGLRRTVGLCPPSPPSLLTSSTCLQNAPSASDTGNEKNDLSLVLNVLPMLCTLNIHTFEVGQRLELTSEILFRLCMF